MTTYTTTAFAILENVTFNGVAGEAGSSISWATTNVISGNFTVADFDSEGDLDVGVDQFANQNIAFTGYTITISGVEYGVFGDGTGYYVPFLAGQTVIPASGNSNAFQNPTGTDVFLCFVGGTQIATPVGERAVEALCIGDMVTTVDGREVTVKWIGRQKITAPVNMLHDDRRAPVCITEGTLGNHADLYVSADHGMIVDGIVVNASALVNGASVRFVALAEMGGSFTYYHTETEAHDIILANGAPTETFLDAAGRATFDNHDEYLGLYGTERIIPEMPLPRIASRRLLPDAIKARLGIVDTLSDLDDPSIMERLSA